jgi:hypothetical protein
MPIAWIGQLQAVSERLVAGDQRIGIALSISSDVRFSCSNFRSGRSRNRLRFHSS